MAENSVANGGQLNAAYRPRMLAAVLALVGACSNPLLPMAPTSLDTNPAFEPPRPLREPPPFPTVTRPARIYEAVDRPTYAEMHGSPLASRYVLYDDGTFALQCASANYPFFEYRGAYKDANAHIIFQFENSGGPPWDATATLNDGSLTVQYNIFMQHSDFKDGVYIRAE